MFQKILDFIVPVFIVLGLLNSALTLYLGMYGNFLISIGSVGILLISEKVLKNGR